MKGGKFDDKGINGCSRLLHPQRLSFLFRSLNGLNEVIQSFLVPPLLDIEQSVRLQPCQEIVERVRHLPEDVFFQQRCTSGKISISYLNMRL